MSDGFELPPFPAPLRVALGAWSWADRVGIGRPDFDEAKLVAEARRRTGLHDFGGEEFFVPLRRLLRAFEDEAGLHLLGRAVMRGATLRALETRLRLAYLTDLHPEIEASPVDRPIFITGMQRTGTTKLHRLLSEAPGLRHLSAIEALRPAPMGRPVPDDPADLAARKRLATIAERGMKWISPALFAIHPIEAESPEEDVFLFDVTFVSPAVDASLDVESYTRWIREIDQVPIHRYVRRLIQLLLWQRPGRYLGKTPHYQENLDVLLEVFPDAKVIHTHRDPRKVVPSFASMMAHTGVILSETVDLDVVGRRVADQMANSVERAMVVREGLPSGSVLDVHYDALMRDPVGGMKRIYEFAELEWTAESQASIDRWMTANPQDKYGRHRYALEDFGLSDGLIDERFKRYCEYFDVARED